MPQNPPIIAGTRIGHVHLKVAALERVRPFDRKLVRAISAPSRPAHADSPQLGQLLLRPDGCRRRGIRGQPDGRAGLLDPRGDVGQV